MHSGWNQRDLGSPWWPRRKGKQGAWKVLTIHSLRALEVRASSLCVVRTGQLVAKVESLLVWLCSHNSEP